MSQTEKESGAYASGLAEGRAILSGRSGSTRNIAPNGAHHRGLARATARYLGIGEAELVAQVTAFHRERVERAPDPARYPEAREARDLLLRRYAGMAQAGMDQELIALAESLAFWQKHVMVHRYGKVCNPVEIDRLRERCRVVYLPESDQGPLHFKNIDDPLETWTPKPPEPPGQPWPHAPLYFDGTGSGLHVDEEPAEIFPLNVVLLCKEHCTTVPQVREFLVRYNHFWEGANLLVHDEKGNSAAFEKASRNRIAVRDAQPNGMNYINGMSAFDDSYQAFITGQRRKYLELTGQAADSVEACYFRFCDGVLRNMKRYMGELAAEPTLAKLLAVMTSRDPDGSLCKSGQKVHPDEVNPGVTLYQTLHFLRSRIMLRRQWRGETPVWEDRWEEVRYV